MQNKIISLIGQAVADETNGQLVCLGSSSYNGEGYIIVHCAADYPEYGRIIYKFNDHQATFSIPDWKIDVTIAYTDVIGWAKWDQQVRDYARGCHEWADECCQVVNAYKNGEDVSDW